MQLILKDAVLDIYLAHVLACHDGSSEPFQDFRAGTLGRIQIEEVERISGTATAQVIYGQARRTKLARTDLALRNAMNSPASCARAVEIVGKKYRAEASGQLEIESRILGTLEENDVCIEGCQSLEESRSRHRAEVPAFEWFEAAVNRTRGLRGPFESECYLVPAGQEGRQKPGNISLSAPDYALVGCDDCDAHGRHLATRPQTWTSTTEPRSRFAVADDNQSYVLAASRNATKPVDERDEAWSAQRDPIGPERLESPGVNERR